MQTWLAFLKTVEAFQYFRFLAAFFVYRYCSVFVQLTFNIKLFLLRVCSKSYSTLNGRPITTDASKSLLTTLVKLAIINRHMGTSTKLHSVVKYFV